MNQNIENIHQRVCVIGKFKKTVRISSSAKQITRCLLYVFQVLSKRENLSWFFDIRGEFSERDYVKTRQELGKFLVRFSI